jgi:hypothetical protein
LVWGFLDRANQKKKNSPRIGSAFLKNQLFLFLKYIFKNIFKKRKKKKVDLGNQMLFF